METVHECALQEEFKQVREEVRSRTHAHICTVMLELQSAGNIRLEEATEDSAWKRTCTELLQSRFDAKVASAALGCTSLRVNRVARVHNKPLRLRFDAAVEGDDYSTEYLFWATSGDAAEWDSATIAQQGVPAVTQLARCADYSVPDNVHTPIVRLRDLHCSLEASITADRYPCSCRSFREKCHDGVALTNRLLLADAANLRNEELRCQQQKQGVMPRPRALQGKVLVCRVALIDGYDIAEEHLELTRLEDAFASDDDGWQGSEVCTFASVTFTC